MPILLHGPPYLAPRFHVLIFAGTFLLGGTIKEGMYARRHYTYPIASDLLLFFARQRSPILVAERADASRFGSKGLLSSWTPEPKVSRYIKRLATPGLYLRYSMRYSDDTSPPCTSTLNILRALCYPSAEHSGTDHLRTHRFPHKV